MMIHPVAGTFQNSNAPNFYSIYSAETRFPRNAIKWSDSYINATYTITLDRMGNILTNFFRGCERLNAFLARIKNVD